MDAQKRARRWWGANIPGSMIKATAVLISQAEQAARQDERRKVLDRCPQCGAGVVKKEHYSHAIRNAPTTTRTTYECGGKWEHTKSALAEEVT